MKKRNCRKTPEEIQQHKTAVEIRKMTDAQICDFLNEQRHIGQNEKCVSVQRQSIESFLNGLKSERGIGQATIAKIETYAIKKGFLSGSAGEG